jgi:hypothetical protein
LAGVLALVVAAAAVALPGAASSQRGRVGGSSTYSDPAGDAKSGPDVTAVAVSDDGSKISFAATIANRPSLTDVDAVQAFFDTDKNGATGGGGYEYEVAWISGSELLMHWDGSAFSEVKAASFTGSYQDGKASFSVGAADFGGSTSFAFIVTTTGDTGTSLSDRAPNTGTWVYPSGSPAPSGSRPALPPGAPPVTPKLKTVKPKLAPAVAGKPFTVTMVVTDAATKKGVKGQLACQAKLGTGPLAAGKHSIVASGRASCTWRLPASAKRKRFTGALTVTFAGAKATRSFAVTVH